MKQHDFKDGNRLKRLLLFSIPKIPKKEEVMLILKLGIPSGLQMKEEVTKPWKKNFQKGGVRKRRVSCRFRTPHQMKRHGKSSKIKDLLDASFDLKTVYSSRRGL
jgi:hypothetical protein